MKKQVYIRELGRPSAAAGWRFLTGSEASIAELAGAAGFQFRWDEELQQFAHAAALVVCTPDGRVSRYLYGIEFDPQTLRLSLVEAAAGRIGSPLDRILLTCFSYDAHERRYALAAVKLMRIGGAATLIVLGVGLLALWRRDRRLRRERNAGDGAAVGTEA
jgi:protein SCO1/2